MKCRLCQEPKQLLDILDSLEAQNLALIQSTQESQAALEDAAAKRRVTVARLDTECCALQAQVRQLQQTRDEQAKLCARLRVSSGSRVGKKCP